MAEISQSSDDPNVSLAIQWLRSAGSLLIAGGAGISASAGLDYTSEEVFKKHFPVMHAKGFRCFYEFIGYTDWTPALQWGYLLSQVDLARYQWPPSQIYRELREIAQWVESNNSQSKEDEKYFVITSNADGMFGRNEYPLQRIYTAQGDYGKLQCLRRCSPQSMWPTRDFIDAALPFIDKNTQEITNPDVIPKCRNCGGPVMMNVRGGNWFMEEHLEPMKEAYKKWLQKQLESTLKENKLLVIVEVGVGFNTPSVVRWPMESLAARFPNVRLIRINAMQPQVPPEIDQNKAVGIAMDATEAIHELWKSIQTV